MVVVSFLSLFTSTAFFYSFIMFSCCNYYLFRFTIPPFLIVCIFLFVSFIQSYLFSLFLRFFFSRFVCFNNGRLIIFIVLQDMLSSKYNVSKWERKCTKINVISVFDTSKYNFIITEQKRHESNMCGNFFLVFGFI